MIFQAALGGRSIELDVRSEHGRPVVVIAGRRPELDLVRLSPYSYSLLLDGRSHHLSIRPDRDGYLVILRQQTYYIRLRSELDLTIEKLGMKEATGGSGGLITAPIPGLISEVVIKVGDTVAAGDRLLILEAMKMENEISAPQAGTVSAVHVAPGQVVEQGSLLVELERAPGAPT